MMRTPPGPAPPTWLPQTTSCHICGGECFLERERERERERGGGGGERERREKGGKEGENKEGNKESERIHVLEKGNVKNTLLFIIIIITFGLSYDSLSRLAKLVSMTTIPAHTLFPGRYIDIQGLLDRDTRLLEWAGHIEMRL